MKEKVTTDILLGAQFHFNQKNIEIIFISLFYVNLFFLGRWTLLVLRRYVQCEMVYGLGNTLITVVSIWYLKMLKSCIGWICLLHVRLESHSKQGLLSQIVESFIEISSLYKLQIHFKQVHVVHDCRPIMRERKLS